MCGIFDLLLIGTPDEVWWLKKDEKRIAKARIATNATGGAEVASWRWEQVRECFRDPQYYFSILFNFLVMVPNGAFITFNTLIMKSMSFTSYEVILYSMPSQGIAIFFVIVPGLCVQYYPKTRFPWALFVTALATAVFLFTGLCPEDTPKWTKWSVYIFSLPFATAMFLIWPLMSINVAGRTKKTWLTASSLIAYSAGNILGSQIFRDPPRYVRGLIGVSIAMILYMILFVVWWIYYIRENRRRDRVVAGLGLTPEQEEDERRKAGEQDMTDVQVGVGGGPGADGAEHSLPIPLLNLLFSVGCSAVATMPQISCTLPQMPQASATRGQVYVTSLATSQDLRPRRAPTPPLLPSTNAPKAPLAHPLCARSSPKVAIRCLRLRLRRALALVGAGGNSHNSHASGWAKRRT